MVVNHARSAITPSALRAHQRWRDLAQAAIAAMTTEARRLRSAAVPWSTRHTIIVAIVHRASAKPELRSAPSHPFSAYSIPSPPPKHGVQSKRIGCGDGVREGGFEAE